MATAKKTKKITNAVKLVINTKLINISVIRQQYIDQMEILSNHKYYKYVSVIGRVDKFIIVTLDGNVCKIPDLDYRIYLKNISHGLEESEQIGYVKKIYYKIPQLFVNNH